MVFLLQGTVKEGFFEFLRYNSQIYKTVKEMIAVEIQLHISINIRARLNALLYCNSTSLNQNQLHTFNSISQFIWQSGEAINL